MARQADVQRIGAYAWFLILAVAGGTLIIGAVGSSGGKPGTVLVGKVTQPAVIVADQDGDWHTSGPAGISQVSTTE